MSDLNSEVAESFESIFPVPTVAEDWDDVLERGGERPRHQAVGRLRPLRRRRARAALAFAIVAGVAVAALFVSAPWTSSPGFLERAQAALTPPEESILHYRWDIEVSPGSGCAAMRSNEIWIDQKPPHTYRAFLSDCVGLLRREYGGALDTPGRILEFVPLNRLAVPDVIFGVEPDPATGLRESIDDGRAHDEGPVRLGERTVRHIRVDCPPGSTPCVTAHHYVDPETFVPVQVVLRDGFTTFWTEKRFDVVQRYRIFEYLPRTAANLALADIRAQHPDATGP